MAITREAFIDNYLDELRENVELVDAGILKLKNDPENVDELAQFLRALHTIKGSSRMLKFNCIEKLSHGLENVFKGIQEQRYSITTPLIQLVFLTTEYIQAGARKIAELGDDELSIDDLLDVFEKACTNRPYSLEGVKLTREEHAEQKPEPSQPPP